MRKYICVLALILISSAVWSQKDKSARYEEYKALQVAYITDKLELTPEESQKFWPIHNQYEKENRTIRKEVQKFDYDSATKEDALAYLNKKLEAEKRMLALKIEYVEDLKEVIPSTKIAYLFEIEHDFKRKILRNMKERRKEKSN